MFIFGCAAIVATACGGSAHRDRAATLSAGGDLEAAIAELKYALATDPTDVKSHVALARLQLRAERPGAALRHFEIGERNDALSGADRTALAGLYVDRARQRVAAGDGRAYEDLDAASRVDGSVNIAVDDRVAALRLAVASSLARSEDEAAARAAGHLGSLAKISGDDWLLSLVDPDTAELDSLGRAAAWLYRSGAKRAGLRYLDVYFDRGGREHGRELLDGRLWWSGRDGLPDILQIAELVEAGAVACLVAGTLADLGCGASLLAVAERSPRDAESIRVRAENKFWRATRADEAGAWVIIALRAWLSGAVDSWLGEVTRRVDVNGLVGQLDEVPAYARPTILRALGEVTQAKNALPAATAAATAGGSGARAVVVAEILALGIDARAADDLLYQEPSEPAAWIAAARAARASDDLEREAKLVADAPASVRAAYLWSGGDIGPLVGRWPAADGSVDLGRRHALVRWARAMNAIGPAGRAATIARWDGLGGAPDDPELADLGFVAWGAVDPIAIAADFIDVDAATYDALIDLAIAYSKDPAIADRLARDFVDGRVYAGVRAPIVATLFDALGDPARALVWRERVAEVSEHDPEALHALGVAAARVGDTNRAETHFIAAAAGSGDPGAASVSAVRALVDAGAPVAALLPARRAVQLVAPGEGREAFEAVAEAMVAAGRTADAEVLLGELVAAVAPIYRDAARAYVDGRWDVDSGAGDRWVGRRDQLVAATVGDALVDAYPTDAAIALRYAANAADTSRALEVLERAAAWNPAHVDLRVAMLGLLDPADEAYLAVVSELVLLAQTSEPADASRARAAAIDATGASAGAAGR